MAASKISANGWVRLAEFRSSSNPAKWHVVGVRDLKDGVEQVGCSCPGWRLAKAAGSDGHKKPCRHVKEFVSETCASHDVQLTKEGADWYLARTAREVQERAAREAVEAA
jgi:hypothetical protein